MIQRLPFIKCFKVEDCHCLAGLEGLHERLRWLNAEPRPIEVVDECGIKIFLTLECLSKQCPLHEMRRDAAKELTKATYDRWRDI
jgi:hypothetical protein